MKSLIIARPAALNLGQLWKIVKEIEDNKLKIIGLKEALLDIHFLAKRAKNEKDTEKIEKINEGEKVPCILIAVEGDKTEIVSKEIMEKYGGLVHISQNAEIAKYEISRFFGQDELFSYNSVENEVFFGKENGRWKKIVNLSVEEVENERKKELLKKC